MRELRARPGLGKVLIPGSISVVQQLLDAGELDELHLLVHPVAAQHGRRLFAESPTFRPLRLLSSSVLPTGVLRLTYAPGELPSAGGYEQAAENLPKAGPAD